MNIKPDRLSRAAVGVALTAALVTGGGLALGTSAAVTAKHGEVHSLEDMRQDAAFAAAEAVQHRDDAEKRLSKAWWKNAETDAMVRDVLIAREAEAVTAFHNYVLHAAVKGDAERESHRALIFDLASAAELEPLPLPELDETMPSAPGPKTTKPSIAARLDQYRVAPSDALKEAAVIDANAEALVTDHRAAVARHKEAVTMRNASFAIATFAALVLIASLVTAAVVRRKDDEDITTGGGGVHNGTLTSGDAPRRDANGAGAVADDVAKGMTAASSNWSAWSALDDEDIGIQVKPRFWHRAAYRIGEIMRRWSLA